MTQTNHHEEAGQDKVRLGFWIYLMTDCVLFASLFATFAVLRNNVWNGPSGAEIFSLPYVWVLTMLLLASSFTCGLMMVAAKRQHKRQTLVLLGLTSLLGIAFLGMELFEFAKLVGEGYSWRVSAFLSAFFTLVGMHGLHITAGLLWAANLGWQTARDGLTPVTMKRLTMFSSFWHFLDIVWIFIFTIVYLMGMLSL